MYKNRNHGYQQLRVWQDAVEYCGRFARTGSWRFWCSGASAKRRTCSNNQRPALRRSAATARGSAGDCGSGESVSGLHAYNRTEQINKAEFEMLNSLAYKLENGLLKLVESLERKQLTGDWIDHLIVQESNAVYGSDFSDPSLHHSITP